MAALSFVFWPFYPLSVRVRSGSILVRRCQTSFCPRISDTIEATERSIVWDTKSIRAVLDNSANAHIWNCEADFLPESLKRLSVESTVGVMTISDSECYPTA